MEMTLEEQLKLIEADMRGKIQRRDWHGVADCAMDLRDLEAYARGLRDGHSKST
jgi:hypothetical protein